jgi:hypothetical protein
MVCVSCTRSSDWCVLLLHEHGLHLSDTPQNRLSSYQPVVPHVAVAQQVLVG